MVDLADWVRKARRHKGWTQQELGEKLHLTKANISAWENAAHQPSFEQIMLISKETGYPVPGANHIEAREPMKPDYRAKIPTASEWALLEDIKVLPVDEQEQLRQDLRARAEKYRAYAEQVIANAKGTGSK